MPDLRPEIAAFYALGHEDERLAEESNGGPLEFERTIELMQRHLPPPPLAVLDVGGGPGRYAAWLSARGDDVLLVDPVALHVDQARRRGVSAQLGDARSLAHDRDAVDVVLLMGPLYHLLDERDRVLALREAYRVLRPGGLLIATAIARYAALQDLLVRLDRLHEPGVWEVAERAARTGELDGATTGLFTTAFLHLPEQLRDEIVAAGFGDDVALFNVEGPGFLDPAFELHWQDPARRRAMLAAARLVEDRPELLAAASHLLAVARAPAAS